MRYRPRPRENEAVVVALPTLAGRQRRFGYRQLTRMLRRRLGRVNHKRVYRLYRKHGLKVPVRRRRRPPRMPRQPMTVPQRPNACWSMDFVHDRTTTGPLRTLSVLDPVHTTSAAAHGGPLDACRARDSELGAGG
jgi:putative transposase